MIKPFGETLFLGKRSLMVDEIHPTGYLKYPQPSQQDFHPYK